jgi:outer membrane autotransporter protein
MANIHAGGTGFSSSGFTLNGDATTFDNSLAGRQGLRARVGHRSWPRVPENRWGFFVTGLGEFTNGDSTPNANGYDVNTGGMTIGVDYPRDSLLRRGVAGWRLPDNFLKR